MVVVRSKHSKHTRAHVSDVILYGGDLLPYKLPVFFVSNSSRKRIVHLCVTKQQRISERLMGGDKRRFARARHYECIGTDNRQVRAHNLPGNTLKITRECVFLTVCSFADMRKLVASAHRHATGQ